MLGDIVVNYDFFVRLMSVLFKWYWLVLNFECID